MQVILLSCLLCAAATLQAPESRLQRLGTLEFQGKVIHGKDISAICKFGAYLIVASDEGRTVQVLRPTGPNRYAVHHDIELPDNGDLAEEVDVEALTADGHFIYAVGSHAQRRPKLSDKKTHRENIQRLLESRVEPARDRLFRFTLNAAGELDAVAGVTSISLRPRLERNPLFQPFLKIPGKENGVNIEALAIDGQNLIAGFRGPVFREGHVPVMEFPLDNSTLHRIRFVQLGGLGIRSLEKVSDGFLIIGGPVGEGPPHFTLFHWDGNDCIPGSDVADPGTLVALGDIPLPSESPGAKPEGLLVVSESTDAWEVVIVYDSAKDGAPTRFRFAK